MIELTQCDCKEWEDGIKQIKDLSVYCSVHGIHYTAEQFWFCPWCGKKREEVK